MSRFNDNLWIVDKEVNRAKGRKLPLDADDAWQAGALGLMQTDRRAPIDMLPEHFSLLARWRVRGAIVDELRSTVIEARRNYGQHHTVPRVVDDAAIAMARDAGLMPRLAIQFAGAELVDMAPGADEQLDLTWALRRAHKAIKKLPKRTQDMVLRRIAGESEVSIGKHYGLCAARVNQLVWEAVRAFPQND